MAKERFLRLKSGAVYHYTDTLAKRKDAIVIDGPAAAEYFRGINSENAITKKYPARDIDAGVPKRKAPASRGKKRSESQPAPDPQPAPEPAIAEPELTEAERVDQNVANLLAGNVPGS